MNTWFVYDPWGRRIWSEVLPTGPQNPPTWNVNLTFYSVQGKRIASSDGVYETDGNGTPYMIVSPHTTNAYQPNQTAGTKQYFGNKLIQSDGSMLGTDRLGTVRFTQASGPMNYYPYGEERTSTAQGQEKFGTYFRDASGDDYAMARYYQSFGGRFETADPAGLKTADQRYPLTWNRMAYSGDDPVNLWDPSGRILAYAGSSCDVDYNSDGEADGWDCEDYYSLGGTAGYDNQGGGGSGGGGSS